MMIEIVIKAPAKVNMALDIKGIRQDGYHEMQMINHSISLHDTLLIRHSDAFDLTCSDHRIPTDERNTVFRIYKALKKEYALDKAVQIHIEKRIPSQAGLAGGSTDAAAALRGMNDLFGLNLSLQQMIDLSMYIGADIPYCLVGGCALVSGLGEKLEVLPPLPPLWILLIKPSIAISTPWAFEQIDQIQHPFHPNISRIAHYIKTKSYNNISPLLGNSFEEVVFRKYPALEKIKADLMASGAVAAVMSGSGSTMVGYFEDENAARRAGAVMKNNETKVIITRIIPKENNYGK